ncbi:hypothetical protein [Ornithinimicrobium kibberense]|uniref:hypothetical protein n=1 Tax=Ornithinimicrobium kibberense TaxID=282060 RepID=UPI00361BC3C1
MPAHPPPVRRRSCMPTRAPSPSSPGATRPRRWARPPSGARTGRSRSSGTWPSCPACRPPAAGRSWTPTAGPSSGAGCPRPGRRWSRPPRGRTPARSRTRCRTWSGPAS